MNVNSVSGNTPLILAADAGHGDVVRLLIQNKAKVDIANKAGDTALAAAVRKDDTVMAKILLDHGANPYLPFRVVGNSGKETRKLLRRHKTIKNWIKKVL